MLLIINLYNNHCETGQKFITSDKWTKIIQNMDHSLLATLVYLVHESPLDPGPWIIPVDLVTWTTLYTLSMGQPYGPEPGLQTT